MVSLIDVPPEKVKEAFVRWAAELAIHNEIYRTLTAERGISTLTSEVINAAEGIIDGYSHIIEKLSKY